MDKKQKNIDSIDLTKFLLSLCIVAIHASFLNQYIFPFARLPVPVFFIFSGYLVFAKLDAIPDISAKKQKLACIIKRYLKLYLFWFILLLPYTLYLRKYFRSGFLNGCLKFLKSFFLASTFKGSWYIMATILGTVIIFYLSRRISNRGLLLITVPIYLFSTVFTEFSAEIQSVPALAAFTDFYKMILGTPHFSFMIALLYIVLGKILADHAQESRPRKSNLVFLLVCLTGLVFEYCFRLKSKSFPYSCNCFLLLAPAAYFFTAIILHIQIQIRHSDILRKLSTIIYCGHVPILAVVSKCLRLCGVSDPLHILSYSATLLLVIGGGLLLLALEKKHPFRFLKYAH